MSSTTIQILEITAGFYFFMGVILVVFAEPIYNWAQGSSLPLFTKGLFGQAIISYYNVKTRGAEAGLSHWGYCLGFNAGVSLSVALIIAFGVTLIIIALYIIAGIIGLMILGAVLGGGK
ncbi:MAG: hypothetical protein Q8L64_00205 [bacterium]|nr:hypothetical protein [Anaerolineales bacterium]MDP1624167.1 hypothetical protein [bacterium]